MDWIPVLSQAKSLFQVVCGDAEGAKQTQENFIRQCPGVSQVTSAVQAATGDEEAARETQKEFLKTVGGVANGIPVVGHVKGVIHYACGDTEGGDQAMKSSSRTIGVIGGGVGGFVVGGPVGAFAGGIAGGAAMDAITTGIDSAVHDEYRPAGHIATVTSIVTEDKNVSGNVFDLTAGVIFDGLAGKTAGKAVSEITGKIISENAANKMTALDNKLNLPDGEYLNKANAAKAQYDFGQKLQGIKTEYSKTGQLVTNKPPSAVPAAAPMIVVEASENGNSGGGSYTETKPSSRNTDQNNNQTSSKSNSNSEREQKSDQNQNNKNNNNNNNNDNNNNNGGSDQGQLRYSWEANLNETQRRVLQWFRELGTGLEIKTIDELNRLVTVRLQMEELENRCPNYSNRAVRFARNRSATNIREFINYLKFFESRYVCVRDTHAMNYDEATRLMRPKPVKKNWASEQALNDQQLSEEELNSTFEETLSLIDENQMVHDLDTPGDSNIQPDLPQPQLINTIRQVAGVRGIRFGSRVTAVYHILIHRVDPLRRYVELANELIADSNSEVELGQIEPDGSQNVTFKDKTTGKICIVLVKVGRIILKTFF